MAYINGKEVLFSPFPNNVSGSLDIENNGIYNVAEFESVNVKVKGAAPNLITKEITANGEYHASADGADGFSSVTVAIPEYDGTVVIE